MNLDYCLPLIKYDSNSRGRQLAFHVQPQCHEKKSDKRKSGWTFHFPFLFKVSITCFILKTLSSGGCGYIIFPIRVFMCLKFMSDQ